EQHGFGTGAERAADLEAQIEDLRLEIVEQRPARGEQMHGDQRKRETGRKGGAGRPPPAAHGRHRRGQGTLVAARRASIRRCDQRRTPVGTATAGTSVPSPARSRTLSIGAGALLETATAPSMTKMPVFSTEVWPMKSVPRTEAMAVVVSSSKRESG